MERRVDYATIAPGVRAAMWGLEEHVHHSGLERSLVELVDLRASLINRCTYCVDTHTKVTRSSGDTEQWLYRISVWRETPFFSARERAALAWTEAVTRISVDGVSDEAYALAQEQFSEAELVELTMAIVAINGWNRLAIACRANAGGFRVTHAAEGLALLRKARRQSW